jgi:hypothetical protein
MWGGAAKIREAQIRNGFKSAEVAAKQEAFVGLCKSIANKFDVSEARQEAVANEFKNDFKELEKYLVACSKADSSELPVQLSCALQMRKLYDAGHDLCDTLQESLSVIAD